MKLITELLAKYTTNVESDEQEYAKMHDYGLEKFTILYRIT